MFCPNCGKELPDGAKFCMECGTPMTANRNNQSEQGQENHFNLKQMVCKHCGAMISYSDQIDHVTCNYCGATFMIDDAATETDRVLRAQSNAKKRDQEADIDYMRQQKQMELEYEEKRKELEEAETFKKSGFSKFIIVCAVICGMLAVSNYRIMPKIIALAQLALFVSAYLMGRQVIKTKQKETYIIVLVIGFALCVPFMLFNR